MIDRDEIALRALQAILAQENLAGFVDKLHYRFAAEKAYRIADAMLSECDKDRPKPPKKVNKT